jgi:hypothetical protein
MDKICWISSSRGTNKNQDNFKFKTDYAEPRTRFNNLLSTRQREGHNITVQNIKNVLYRYFPKNLKFRKGSSCMQGHLMFGQLLLLGYRHHISTLQFMFLDFKLLLNPYPANV